MYGTIDVPMTREEISIVWDVLFDHYQAKQKELEELTQKLKTDGSNPRFDFDKYKLEQYIETVANIRNKMGFRL